jgi:hypothetical protein
VFSERRLLLAVDVVRESTFGDRGVDSFLFNVGRVNRFAGTKEDSLSRFTNKTESQDIDDNLERELWGAKVIGVSCDLLGYNALGSGTSVAQLVSALGRFVNVRRLFLVLAALPLVK